MVGILSVRHSACTGSTMIPPVLCEYDGRNSALSAIRAPPLAQTRYAPTNTAVVVLTSLHGFV